MPSKTSPPRLRASTQRFLDDGVAERQAHPLEARRSRVASAEMLVRDVLHAALVNQFLDEAHHAALVARKAALHRAPSCPADRLAQKALAAHQRAAGQRVGQLLARQEGGFTRVVFAAIHVLRPIARAPILDEIQAARFEVILVEVPEREAG